LFILNSLAQNLTHHEHLILLKILMF
jgi:hypothetical protein